MTKSRLGRHGAGVDALKEMFKIDLIITYRFSTLNPGLYMFHPLLTWYCIDLFKVLIVNCLEKVTHTPFKIVTNKQKPFSKSTLFCIFSVQSGTRDKALFPFCVFICIFCYLVSVRYKISPPVILLRA